MDNRIILYIDFENLFTVNAFLLAPSSVHFVIEGLTIG